MLLIGLIIITIITTISLELKLKKLVGEKDQIAPTNNSLPPTSPTMGVTTDTARSSPCEIEKMEKLRQKNRFDGD